MKLSPQGAHLIASFEGWRPDWYDDGTGTRTIGYGHTGGLPVGWKAPLTIEQGLQLLGLDAAFAGKVVSDSVKVSLGTIFSHRQARFDALVSLTFNIGAGAFKASTLLKRINEHGAPRDWTVCGPYWLEFSYAGNPLRFLPGLHARRVREFAVFEPGLYPAL